ncbi:outer membrane protein assembly factor BamB family protein [Nocardia xishanensis]|uniref:outer membrane protein assembly factor BamB family protein n=1 Tax=Nocardia xishanensis TaxID=238964 RepID=UPI00083202B0|nr:PQQ-binding-like beta-propeller repeat protein [Nocardia xishanensis]
MAWPPGIRNLVLAAVAAVVTSAGAVAVLLHPEDGTRKITGTVDAAPGLGWSIDAVAIDGRAAAEFRDPLAGTEFDMDTLGFVDAGDTLVTVIGVADGSMLRDPMMYGIDAGTGATRWRAPAGELGGCAGTPVDGDIICFTSPIAEVPALIGYDVASGAITRTPIDWLVFSLAAADDRVYVAEGDVESDDVRVHSGTLADPDSYWTRGFEMGTSWEDMPSDALDVSHGQGVLTLGADVAGFDLRDGDPTWTAELHGCSRITQTFDALVLHDHTGCSGNSPTGAEILDRAGHTLVATGGEGVHDLTFDRPADATIPVLLADGAYDRRDGAIRWTDPDLVQTGPDRNGGGANRGTATAVLGDVAVLHDSATRTATGVELRTGQHLWRRHTERFGTVQGWDGHVAVLTDATGLWAIDTRTGEIVWDIPFLAVDADPDAITGGGELSAKGDGHYLYAARRTIIGLRPLGG